jgi:hypothetical protein
MCRAFAPHTESSRRKAAGAAADALGKTQRHTRSQHATLHGIRELCRSRILSHGGVHTHGDVMVDHKCRSARVLVDTCDAVASMAHEVELEHTQAMAALTREVTRLRAAMREWDSVFGESAAASSDIRRSFCDTSAVEERRRSTTALSRTGFLLTPKTLAAELQSLRAQVSDLQADNAQLRRAQTTSAAQLAQIIGASRDRNDSC